MTFGVCFIVFPGFQLQQVAGPLSIFEAVCGYGTPAYEPKILSERGGLVKSSVGIEIDTIPFSAVTRTDILFVCGGYGYKHAQRSGPTIEYIRSLGEQSGHVAAAASGTMLLAASGLLDGHRVTAHWTLNKELAAHYPTIEVGNDDFIVRDRRFWTSNISGGGMEIARLMVEEDLGLDAAKRAAREFLDCQRAASGVGKAPEDVARFKSLISWARANLTKTLSVEDLAEQMGMAPRNFISTFTLAVGQTPAKAIERIRLEEALALIEQDGVPIESIRRQVGFTSLSRMRRAFIRTFGVPPKRMQEILRLRAAGSEFPPLHQHLLEAADQ